MSSVARPTIQSLHMHGIVKRFPGVLALNQVDFDVQAGEIHTLLGENGAGKSTLMKLLYGLYQPDSGTIVLNGQPIQNHSPQDAIQHGIGMIHQHFMLVPSLTVAENIALGLPSARGLLLELDTIRQRIHVLTEQYNLKVKTDVPVWQLSVGEQQRVEILRALLRGAELLILDEPTAVLTPHEVDDLFAVLQQMAQDGHALIFISHKLHEVLAISHRVTVLRDGHNVATIPTAQATKLKLAEMMVGRPVILEYPREVVPRHHEKLRLEGVSARNDQNLIGLHEVSLSVWGGEIVGVAGVSGNGQRELAQAITGLRPVTKGHIYADAQNITHLSPSRINDLGISHIPEERMIDGVIKDFSLAENFVLKEHTHSSFTRVGIFMRFNAIKEACRKIIEAYEIKTPSTDTKIKNLSGGNIQKLILGRELARNPQILIAAQPTRGVDIGATEYIHQRLLEERAKGTAILLISEDLDEILALSDRILVMFEGRIVGEVTSSETRDSLNIQRIGAMMAGVTA